MYNTLEAKGQLSSWASHGSLRDPGGTASGGLSAGQGYRYFPALRLTRLSRWGTACMAPHLHLTPPLGELAWVSEEDLNLCIFTNPQVWVWPTLLS